MSKCCFSVFKSAFCTFLLFACCTSFAENIFIDIDNAQDLESKNVLKMIGEQMESQKIPGPIWDYFKKNDHEYFFRTADGLFYSCASNSSILIDQLFWRSLGQIDVENSFYDKENKIVVLRNMNMKMGIITDWFSILCVSPTRPFEEDDFYKMYGFCEDGEEFGRSDIDLGEKVDQVIIKNIDKDICPEIMIKVNAINYKTNTSEMRMYVFKKTENKFRYWRDGKIISK